MPTGPAADTRLQPPVDPYRISDSWRVLQVGTSLSLRGAKEWRCSDRLGDVVDEGSRPSLHLATADIGCVDRFDVCRIELFAKS